MRWLKLYAVLVLWAGSFILNEVALRSLGPATVVAARWSLTALLVLTLVARRGELPALRRGLRAEFPGFLAIGVVGIALLYGLQVAGQSLTSAVNTGLLANMVGIFTALLAALFLGERLPLAAWVGILVALLGAWVVSAGGLRLQIRSETALGDGLVLISSLVAAIYFVMGKRLLARHSPLVVTAAASALGALVLLPLAAWEGSWRGADGAALASVVALAIGPGLLANLWWWETAQWLEASRAAVYIYLIPLITMAMAVALLHEPLSPAQGVGAGLVLSGVVLAERSRLS